MSEQHTPGRLAVTHNNWETSTIYCEGNEVARVHIDSEASDDDKKHCENARRLVACWNACDGISTEHLERHGLTDFAQKISDLVAQRDELLEALKSCDEVDGKYTIINNSKNLTVLRHGSP